MVGQHSIWYCIRLVLSGTNNIDGLIQLIINFTSFGENLISESSGDILSLPLLITKPLRLTERKHLNDQLRNKSPSSQDTTGPQPLPAVLKHPDQEYCFVSASLPDK